MENIRKLGFLDHIILFFKYSKLNLKLLMQYKFDRGLLAFAVFCREMTSVIVMYLILVSFDHIRDWQLNEMFFLYSFLFLSYSLFVFFFTGIRDFDDMIYTGDFDRFLLRPLGLLYQIVSSRIDFCATIGHGAVGVLLFLKTAGSVGIEWNMCNTIYYITALIGGALIQAALFMISSSFSFWTVKTVNLRNMIFFNSRRFAGYPISIYPWVIQKLLIFVIPFGFVSYFPAQFFLQKPEIGSYWSGYMYMPLLVGVIMYALVYAFWKVGLKNYSSTGNSMY